ncbi:MAG: hypothetical protein M3337_07510 [Actinomycetota bacterium]|nr:hypothetical protein [Actinomycetota bacterium]
MTASSSAHVPRTDARPAGGDLASYIPATAASARRRRPSGAAPPLPRSLGSTGKAWLVLLVLLVIWVVVTLSSASARRLTDRFDATILRAIARVRVDWLTTIFRGLDRIATGWIMFAIGVGLIVAMIAFRRWRHLFTFLASVFALELAGLFLVAQFSRPRPYDVTIIGRWRGFALPSATAMVIAFTVMGVIYTMVVPGRARTIAKVVGAAIIATFVGARLYLGVDHPFDVMVGVALGVAIPLNAFRYFVPNEIFPITYRRQKTAHLDVDGRRGEALRRAIADQVGVKVLDVEHVGLAESGGSTPMRLLVAGQPDGWVFGKLYAKNHVRADRWYKLGRTLLYGRLEDEAPFESVLRLAQHEDYALRLLRDVGIRAPAPLGVLELTPEREYLLLTEFYPDAIEIGEAEVDDQLIDEGLTIIRQLWDSGLAHRDIKPANLLVGKDGHLQLIDAAFVQIRPSPWRQAVDLANMMLVLAVRTDAERVYQRALTFFTPDDIAEAFAAVSGIASPTQLRAEMKRDGRDLRAQFRVLAPARRPISMQQWSARRVLLALAVLGLGGVALSSVYGMLTPAELPVQSEPTCGTGDVMVLMAQAVPTATQVPCLASLPAGFDVGGVEIRRGRAWFSLDSDQAGNDAVEVTLLRPQDCSLAGATEVLSDELGMQRFEQPIRLPPALEITRTYVFNGGCVTYRFSFDGGANASVALDVDAAVAFQPRSALVREVEQDSGLRLCGAGSPTCPGGSG